jgi:hypothetical protein
MVTARCGPAFDLEDVRATLGSDPTCIASSMDAAAARHLATALSNAMSSLHLQVTDPGQLRGVVAMMATRSSGGELRGVKELGRLLRAALPPHASVICAGMLEADLDSEVQVRLWARIR